jgi:iron-sulfur cluster repair protein YtfE (RIC family)
MKDKALESEAVRILKRDHKRIQDLFFHFEQSEDWNHKLSFAETAMNEIALHSVIEEECVYPLLEERHKKKLSKRVRHSQEEHEEIDEVMMQLANRETYDELYHELFATLAKKLKKHIAEEEDDLLPALDEIATDELGQSMSALKNQLLRQYDGPTDKDFSPQVLLFERLRERRRSA